MNDTTDRPEAARRLTGCPWPTGIHRFVLGVCSRCGTDDLNPLVSRGGFTDQDDQPIPYVPTEAAALADAMRWTPEELEDLASGRVPSLVSMLDEARAHLDEAHQDLADEDEGCLRRHLEALEPLAARMAALVRSW
jgi:hypothetical protein